MFNSRLIRLALPSVFVVSLAACSSDDTDGGDGGSGGGGTVVPPAVGGTAAGGASSGGASSGGASSGGASSGGASSGGASSGGASTGGDGSGGDGSGGDGSGGDGSGGASTGGDGSGGDGSGGDGSGGDAATLSYASDVEPILVANCVPCHVDATMPSGTLDLSMGAGYGSLVDQDSTSEAPLKRVVAGDSGASYLINKLEGTNANFDAMPKGKASLSSDDIQTIKDWIDAGAEM